ncbi:MAG: GNAT family N-acetyltransferase [Planctomycetota bacterium]
MPHVFRTERLVVRPWTLDDAEDAFEIYGDAEVMRYLHDPVPDVETQRKGIAALLTRVAAMPRGLGLWAIEERARGRVCGMALLKPLSDEGEVEVGWHLARRAWGRGFATEAGRGCLRHGFDVVGLDEIVAVVQPANGPSLRVVERLGMEPAGTCLHHDLEHLRFVMTADAFRRG